MRADTCALAGTGGFTLAQRRHVAAGAAAPAHRGRRVDFRNDRAYIGQYTADGSRFIAAYQDSAIRVYAPSEGYAIKLLKSLKERMPLL